MVGHEELVKHHWRVLEQDAGSAAVIGARETLSWLRGLFYESPVLRFSEFEPVNQYGSSFLSSVWSVRSG